MSCEFSGTLDKSIERFGVVLPMCSTRGEPRCSHFQIEKHGRYCARGQYMSPVRETFEEIISSYFCRHVNAFRLAQEADSLRKLEEI